MNLQGIAEAYSQVHEKKDSSYLETDMKKRQKNNEKARKDMEKMGTSMKNPHFESKTYDPMEDPDFDHDEAEATRGQSGKNIRGNDSAKQKKRLEKKRGMKLDDHPQFKKEEAEVEEGYGAPGHNPGSGEKDIARTKKYMEKKGMKGAPGLDAMAARKKEHEERRGVKKEGFSGILAAYHAVYDREEVEQVDEAGRMHSASSQQAGFQRIKDKESGGPGVGKVRSDDEIRKQKGGQAFLDKIAKAKAKMNKEEVEQVDENRAAMGRINREYKRKKEAEEMEARTKSAKGKKKDTSHMGKGNPMYDPSVNTRAKNFKFTGEEVEMEGYKGKHGQSDKEYADSRSSGGKMVSGDSKMSGAEYTHGRRVKAANPGMQPDVGGKTKPKSQGKMDAGSREDLKYRKTNLARKHRIAKMQEELEGNPVYEATKKDIKEFVGQALNSAGQALAGAASTPVGAGLVAGTAGAVTGGKKKIKRSVATGAGAAAGAALGGLPGAVIGGIAGRALS